MPRPLGAAIALAALIFAPAGAAFAAVRTDAQAVAVVRAKLEKTPETRARLKGLKKTPYLLYVENKPGELDRYYHVYAGEDQGDHRVRLWSLLVDPRTDEVLGYDLLEDRQLSWKAFVAKVKAREL